VYTLRKAICSYGYFIAHEQLVKDNNIIYVVIHFQKGFCQYTNDDYLFGPLLRMEKDNLYKEALYEDIKKKEILYSQIPHKYFWQRHQLKNTILKYKNQLK
jgi:tRNA A22 N-methylase